MRERMPSNAINRQMRPYHWQVALIPCVVHNPEEGQAGRVESSPRTQGQNRSKRNAGIQRPPC